MLFVEADQPIDRSERASRDSSPLFINSDSDEQEQANIKPRLKTEYNGFSVHENTLWFIVSRRLHNSVTEQELGVADSWVPILESPTETVAGFS